MGSINTRFYLSQETVDFTKESPRAFEFMMRSTETKKVSYMCSKPECFRYVSINGRAVVERGFKEALMRNDIAAECYEVSSEIMAILQCEQHPEQALSSSTPTLEEEEMKIIDEVDNDNDTAEEAQKQQKKRQWKRKRKKRKEGLLQ